VDTSGMTFFPHDARVRRTADGRTGTVKDVMGHEVSVIWDGAAQRHLATDWVAVTELEPAD
jgi:hypothetical protein